MIHFFCWSVYFWSVIEPQELPASDFDVDIPDDKTNSDQDTGRSSSLSCSSESETEESGESSSFYRKELHAEKFVLVIFCFCLQKTCRLRNEWRKRCKSNGLQIIWKQTCLQRNSWLNLLCEHEPCHKHTSRTFLWV